MLENKPLDIVFSPLVPDSTPLFPDILNNAPIGIFTSTPEGRLVAVNHALARMLGYGTPEEVIESISDIGRQTYADPADREYFQRLLDLNAEVVNYECRRIKRDGSVFWMSTNAWAVRDKDGKIIFYQGFNTNITDRKRAQEALQNQLRFEQALAEAAACLLKPQATRQNILDCLACLRTVTNVARVYIFENFDDPDDGLCIRQTYEVCAPGVHAEIDNPALQHVAYRKGFDRWREAFLAGKPVWGHVADFPVQERDILDSQGILSLLVLPVFTGSQWGGFIGFDETRTHRTWQEAEVALLGTAAVLVGGYLNRIRSEDELRQSNAFLDSIIENMPSLVFLKDAGELRYVRVNRAFENLLGYSRAEMLGKSSFELFRREDAHCFAATDRQTLREKTTLDIPEELWQTREKGLRTLHTRKVPILNADCEPEYLLGISEDITDRKKADTERAKLQEQLTHCQKIESIGRLAGGVAHDFNNLLSVILWHTDTALGQLSPGDPLFDDLQEISRSARRSADLTRQLLAFARKQTIHPKVLELNAIVEGMLRMLRRLIGEDIHLAWQPGRCLWPVKVDPSQIDQILVNLCVNARDAIAGVGVITIATENDTLNGLIADDPHTPLFGDYVRLLVKDDGCGMAAETLDKLFEPFFTTKPMGQGTGLGLATVYGIVKQNEGFVQVQSTPGQGTHIIIHLPRHDGKHKGAQR
jgi:PAS domain S-box-containing protein